MNFNTRNNKSIFEDIKKARQGEVSRVEQEKQKYNQENINNNVFEDNKYTSNNVLKNARPGGFGYDEINDLDEFIEDDIKDAYNDYNYSEAEDDHTVHNFNNNNKYKKIKENKQRTNKLSNKEMMKANDVLDNLYSQLDDDKNNTLYIDNNKYKQVNYGKLNPNIAPSTFNKETKSNIINDNINKINVEQTNYTQDYLLEKTLMNNSTNNNEENTEINDILMENNTTTNNNTKLGGDRIASKPIDVINENNKRIRIDDDDNEHTTNNANLNENKNLKSLGDIVSNNRELSTVKNELPTANKNKFNDSNFKTPYKKIDNLNLNNKQNNYIRNTNESSLALSAISKDSNLKLRNINTNESLPVEKDGSLFVYWYDAYEEPNSKNDIEPKVILFGKVKNSNNDYSSISVIIRNLKKTLYLFPKLDESGKYYDTFEMFQEFDTLKRTKFNYIEDYESEEELKKYAFELPISPGEYNVLKITYNARYGNIPEGLSGNTFDYIFGRKVSLLESVILSLKLKGPSWIKLSHNSFAKSTNFLTWSKYEVIVENMESIITIYDNDVNFINYGLTIPPLRILSLATKYVNIHGVKELISIDGVVKESLFIDRNENISSETDRDCNNMSALIITRKLNNLEPDILKFRSDLKNNSALLVSTEVNLLNVFLQKLFVLDPDVVIGHNLYSTHLDIILSRISKLKIQNWSKIGKIKREVFPKYLQSNSSSYVRTCLVGRLICDTFLSSRDIYKESNYDIDFLANKYLDYNYEEIDVNNILENTNSNNVNGSVSRISKHTLEEAILCYRLMYKMQILQLSKQLTNIAGNLWIKSLQNSRADRCEMLLLHEFTANNYLVPEKLLRSEKFEDNLIVDNDEFINDRQGNDASNKRRPQYGGGLVLEPKAGLYDNIVLLLDFNSLYPSIIREYNICFTTVDRKPTENFDNNIHNNFNKNKKLNNKITNKKHDIKNIKDISEDNNENKNTLNNEEEINLNNIKKTDSIAILPSILTFLVNSRKEVKNKLKIEKDTNKKANLEIEQKALKLSANSLYGYLGYKNSRFYAKSIAALITSTGRKILEKTVELVQNKLNLQVIYGDTDSIMILTETKIIEEALKTGLDVKKSINGTYKLLEMEIDGVFKTLLLLKKKKYAALKYEPPFCYASKLSAEYKGLDLVRRDWCELSKQVGLYILDLILKSEGSKEETTFKIIDFLKEVNKKMDNNEYDLDQYIIVKQLTKKIEDYTDAKSLPHVKVAKRMLENGDNTIKSQSYIHYVICKLKDTDSKSNQLSNINPTNSTSLSYNNKSIGEKAYHVKEIAKNNNLAVDVDWYKENQILSSVSRLCKHIEELDMYRIAEAIGINSNKYDNINKIDIVENTNYFNSNNENNTLINYISNPYILYCSNCNEKREFSKIYDDSMSNINTLITCNSCKKKEVEPNVIINQLMLGINKRINKYYNLAKICDKCETKNTNIFLKTCKETNCRKGKLRQDYSECDVIKELNFIYTMFSLCESYKSQESNTKNESDKYIVQNFCRDYKIIIVYLEKLQSSLEYNIIDLGQIFNNIQI